MQNTKAPKKKHLSLEQAIFKAMGSSWAQFVSTLNAKVRFRSAAGARIVGEGTV